MDFVGTVEVVGALGLAGLGAWLIGSQLKPKATVTPGDVDVAKMAGGLSAHPTARDAQHRPKSQLPILRATELLTTTGAQADVEKIRTRLGLSPGNFERDVVPLINRLAEYVQYLPASESHHHAQPGGLLQHTLEVAAHALTLRQGYKLPLGATPEDQIRLAAVWSYGVLVAALLHDIGKPVADVVVQLFGSNIHAPVARWSGLGGSMVQAAASESGSVTGGLASPVSHYTVAFPAAKDYQAHQRLPLMLLHALLPPSSLQWLSGDAQLMQELMLYLESQQEPDKPSALREIVTKADSWSVATNLATGSRTRFATARSVPLIERLMRGLRTLLSEGHLAVNRPGAAAFVDPDETHIWIVAGVAAEQTRNLLLQREEKLAGAAGLPTDNTRFFDTWSEYGALVPPDKAHGKGSVWWVRIDIEGWSQVLTVLKFRLDKLYAPGQPHPSVLQGAVTPVSPKTERTATNEASIEASPGAVTGEQSADGDGPAAQRSAEGTDSPPSPPDSDLLEQPSPSLESPSSGQLEQRDFSFSSDTASEPSSPDTGQDTGAVSLDLGVNSGSGSGGQSSGRQDDWSSLPHLPALPPFLPTNANAKAVAMSSPATPAAATPAVADDEYLDESDSARVMPPASGAAPGRAVQAMKAGKPPKALFNNPNVQDQVNAQAFMAWIQAGLGTGDLNYNESDAVVHFVPEGMALVTPRAFKIYLEGNAFIGSIGQSKDALRALQNEVQKSGYIARNSTDKGSFHFYQVHHEDGDPGAVITTYVVPNPQAYIRPVPSPNPLLKRCNAPPKRPTTKAYTTSTTTPTISYALSD